MFKPVLKSILEDRDPSGLGTTLGARKVGWLGTAIGTSSAPRPSSHVWGFGMGHRHFQVFLAAFFVVASPTLLDVAQAIAV